MKINDILTEQEQKIMNQKASITGQPDREFLMQFIGDHYKELDLNTLILWEIANCLKQLNITARIPESAKEEQWFE